MRRHLRSKLTRTAPIGRGIGIFERTETRPLALLAAAISSFVSLAGWGGGGRCH